MRKKKKGSSLLVVTMVMAILFITGTSILSLTASDYKMRINESKKLENLYKSDSGLDVVYNVIVKNCESAIIYANEKIIDEYGNKSNKSKVDEEINSKFKEHFIKFLGTDKNNANSVLPQGIIGRKYIKKTESDQYDWVEDDKNNAEIELVDYKYDTLGKKIEIDVTSTFSSSNGENGSFKNTKTIATKYEVQAPDYQGIIVSESENIKIGIYPVFDGKAITADGNMRVSGNLYVKGDIWVKGNQNLGDNPSYVFDKYKGGIVIENGTLNSEGNVCTANTLHLKNSANVNVEGDIYALNAYVGKDTSIASSTRNNLSVNGNLVVNNDLALNATESNIIINKDFYGINDKNTSKTDTLEKAMNSSSIIINEISTRESGDPTSTITVEKDSYIMGVAHIDATNKNKEEYKTGESVAVKGNYLAYTDILPGYEDKVILEYYNPLQLIEKIEGSDSIENKAKYITEYYEKNSDKLNNGGVNLKGKVNSVGAYIEGKKSKFDGWVSENDSVIANKRSDFAREVFSMGDITTKNNANENVDMNPDDVYANGEVVKSVENQINFDKITSNSKINNNHGKLILRADTAGEKAEDIVINNDVFDGEKLEKAVIITEGNVVINGKVDFKGIIIAKGNVIFKGDGEKKIIYDEDIVRKIIASNYEVLKDILSGTSKSENEINIGENINIESMSNGYDVDSFVKTKRWKILK